MAQRVRVRKLPGADLRDLQTPSDCAEEVFAARMLREPQRRSFAPGEHRDVLGYGAG